MAQSNGIHSPSLGHLLVKTHTFLPFDQWLTYNGKSLVVSVLRDEVSFIK